ncbi:MAG: IscS subfamily cysteine desulfurase [Ginsengibacter sp.]
MKLPVYLDNNATTQMDARVLEAMMPYFTDHYGNAASRSHSFGWQAEEAVDFSREQIAKLINAYPKEIIFTSGATEADNLALKGVYEMYASKGNHIITVATEHKAVLDTCKHLEKIGAEITFLPVQKDGLIDVAELEAAMRPTTILVAVMYANNETGVIQPVKEISKIARKFGALFFTDATQAVGKIPVDIEEDGIDLVAFSGHKIYGPKGVGALFVRRKNPRVKLTPQMDGGGHERGMRSGTLNVSGIVGLGKACELCGLEMQKNMEKISGLRDKLEHELLKLHDTFVNGSLENRLPHVSNISFKYVDSEGLLLGLNKNVALSSGSACTSATLEPSYVLKEMGVEDDLAKASIRFGLSQFTTEEEIDYVIKQVTETVMKLRENNPLLLIMKNEANLENIKKVDDKLMNKIL